MVVFLRFVRLVVIGRDTSECCPSCGNYEWERRLIERGVDTNRNWRELF